MTRTLVLWLLVTSATVASAAPPLELLPAGDYARKVVAPHKGHSLLVSFWATWCEPCREELPALIAATAGQKVDVVLVSLDSATDLDPVRAFLKSIHAQGSAFVVAPGDPELVINSIDATWDGTLPYTLVYGPNGKIAARLRGAQREEDFKRAVAAVAKQKNRF